MSEEEKIQKITKECYQRHADDTVRNNSNQQKVIRRLLIKWATIPLGIFGTLLIWVLATLYNIGVSSAGRNEKMDRVLDAQTITIASEADQREMTDTQLKSEIDQLKVKIDADMKWLIENMNSKYRGPNPLLKQPQ